MATALAQKLIEYFKKGTEKSKRVYQRFKPGFYGLQVKNVTTEANRATGICSSVLHL